MVRGLLVAAVVVLALPASRGATAPQDYSARRPISGTTTPRPAATAPTPPPPDSGTGFLLDARIPGLLSFEGLPPMAGVLQLSSRAAVFHPRADGGPVYLPLYHESRWSREPGRRPAISLYTVADAGGREVWLFHLDASVFETATPGLLRPLGESSTWVDSVEPAVSSTGVPLVGPEDRQAMLEKVRSLASSSYADTLYRLFGAPDRAIGVVGKRGQAAGRLGEYVASRDSISLSPAQMTHQAQLRHTFTHELAHRWQRKKPKELASLWRGVPPIADSLRYGYQRTDEHQAEAVAFAVHYLQTTGAPAYTTAQRLALLDSYERLVPGTRHLAREFLTRRVYEAHPLVGHTLAPPAVLRALGTCGLPAGRAPAAAASGCRSYAMD